MPGYRSSRAARPPRQPLCGDPRRSPGSGTDLTGGAGGPAARRARHQGADVVFPRAVGCKYRVVSPTSSAGSARSPVASHQIHGQRKLGFRRRPPTHRPQDELPDDTTQLHPAVCCGWPCRTDELVLVGVPVTLGRPLAGRQGDEVDAVLGEPTGIAQGALAAPQAVGVERRRLARADTGRDTLGIDRGHRFCFSAASGPWRRCPRPCRRRPAGRRP